MYHREPALDNQPYVSDDNDDNEGDNELVDNEEKVWMTIPDLVEDHYRGTYMDGLAADTIQREEVRNFEKLLEVTQGEVYTG